jgi:hypothetical protein
VEGRRGLLEYLPQRLGVEVPDGLLDLIELDLLEPHPDAADVGQVAGADHLRDPALVDDLLPDVAELFAVGARWRGGHAEDKRRGGEVLQDPAVAPRAGVMRLVDDDCVELLGQSCEPVGARERLHAADDDGAADVVALRGDDPTPSASVGSAIAIFSAAWRKSSSRWASTSALPPRRAIRAANKTVLPHPVGRTTIGRFTPRLTAAWTASTRLVLVWTQAQRGSHRRLRPTAVVVRAGIDHQALSPSRSARAR